VLLGHRLVEAGLPLPPDLLTAEQLADAVAALRGGPAGAP
jgi:hypothetical protein